MMSANDPKPDIGQTPERFELSNFAEANPFKFSCIGLAPSGSRQDFDLYCVGSSHSRLTQFVGPVAA